MAFAQRVRYRLSSLFAVFGVKLVNGHPASAVLGVHNQETEAIQIMIVAGSLCYRRGRE